MPPLGSKFFQIHALFGKIWQSRMLAPPLGELTPAPRGNPGPSTANHHQQFRTELIGQICSEIALLQEWNRFNFIIFSLKSVT